LTGLMASFVGYLGLRGLSLWWMIEHVHNKAKAVGIGD
jgi:hypothetical protein